MKTAFIIYCSPSGSTRHVAQVMANACKEKSAAVQMIDLGIVKDPSAKSALLKNAGPKDSLFIGSPVYQGVAIPPVMNFLYNLPLSSGCTAVPFVTWGGATSGIALWQMGQALESKGYGLVGAAKVMAVHSMMWQSDHPVGQGRPDAEDDQQVIQLVKRVVEKIGNKTPETIALETLDYQPETIQSEHRKKLGQPWVNIPKSLEEEKCTQCAICKQVCPVRAVTLDPLPSFNERCFSCFNCVRECPESAIVPGKPMAAIESMIRNKVETIAEKPPTDLIF